MSGRPVTGHHDELDLDDVALDVDEPVGPEANDEDTVAIRAFNDRVASDDRVESVLLPIGDGLTFVRKR